LTDILRKYIEDRFHLMAMESTTGRSLKTWKKRLDPERIPDDLGDILSMADLVKFAKYLPLPEDHEHSLEYALIL